MIPTVLLDFETSGLNPYHDDIIEIAMKELNTENKFTALVRPKSNELISDEITRITGITNKMLVKQGRQWEDVYRDMNTWLLSLNKDKSKISIVSHNGEGFDFIFLKRILKDLTSMNIRPLNINNIIFIDTLLLAKRLIPKRYSYKQKTLCQSFNITTEGSHRAMNDVIALEKLLSH